MQQTSVTSTFQDPPHRVDRLDPIKVAATFTYDEVQLAIDEVFDLRAKVIRIGLLGTLLHRPDPDRDIPQEERESHMQLLDAQATTFDAVTRLLVRGTPHAFVTGALCDWMMVLAHQCPDELAKLVQLNELTQRLRTAALNATPGQSELLRDHMRVARQGFHPAIVTICEHMWACFDTRRESKLAEATAAATALQGRLTRLERIGSHVRLVSLNASVEAARAGDAGKGLMVIAREVKSLAEEIRNLAKEARNDIGALP